MEHYPQGTTFEDLEMKRVDVDMFSFYSEIDVEDTDSDIHELNVDTETDSEMEGFIVSDTEMEGQDIAPPGFAEIDKQWDEWKPSTPGASSFKETIDLIENRIRRLSA